MSERFHRILLFVFVILLVWMPASGWALISVSLPTATGEIGQSVTLPISTGDLTDQGVVAYQLTFTYDPAVLKVTAVDGSGTLSTGMTLQPNLSVPGQVMVAAAGTAPLTGAGTLLNLQVKYVGVGTSPLRWVQFLFNEGRPVVHLTDGSVVVSSGPAISIGLLQESGQVGDTLLVPITVGDVTGRGVTAYQLTFTYDPVIVKVTAIDTSGTLSAGMTLQPNLGVPGQVTVAAAGTASLTRAGTLLKMKVQGVVAGVSPMRWSSFVFNEGHPVVVLSDGSVTVSSGPAIDVGLPQITGQVGDTLVVPVTVGDVTGRRVMAYQLTIGYDPAIVKVLAVDKAGTLSGGMTLQAHLSEPGRVTVAAGGMAPLTGTGTLVKLKVRCAGVGVSALHWQQFLLNEGYPVTNLSDGRVTVESGAAIDVELPYVSGQVGDTLVVPVTVGDVAGRRVMAYQLTVTYDPRVMKVLAVDKAGTLSGEMTLQAHLSEPGRVTVAAGGTVPLTGTGTLIRLKITALRGGTSELHWANFSFNEGYPLAGMSDGRITVTERPAVTIGLPDTTGAVGDTLTIPVSVGALTGRGVMAYQLTVTYTPEILKVVDVVVDAGTLSEGMNVQANLDRPGQAMVAAAGRVPLTGSGALVRLKVECVAAGTSALRWTKFVFDEGTPPASTNDGSVIVEGTPVLPPIPTLVSPLNESVNQPLVLMLNWSPSAGATTYRLQVSTSSEFTTTVFSDYSITGRSRQIGPLTSNTTYYWRVSARNAAGTRDWSSAGRFTTGSTTETSVNRPPVARVFFPANAALELDGSNDFVSMGDVLDVGDGSFTVEAWVKTDVLNNAYHHILSKNQATFPNYILAINPSNTFQFSAEFQSGQTDDVSTSNLTLSTGTWYHIAGVRDVTDCRLRIYVNGMLEGEVTPTTCGGNLNNTQPFKIGVGTSSLLWDGLIDEVRVWNVARTQDEIQVDMNRTLTGNETGLVGYWSFDEGSGGTAYDQTVNRNDGTLGSGSAMPARVTSTAPIRGNFVTIKEDTDVTLALGGTDADGDPLTTFITTLPANGRLYQTPDGITRGSAITSTPAMVTDIGMRVLFAPAPDGYGRSYDSFGFVVNDGSVNSESEEATVTVQVLPVNDPPVAVNDTVTTEKDAAIIIRVLGNDTDVDGDPLSITARTQGTYGSVVISSGNTTVTYTPNANFVGTDTFTYTVGDGKGGTATASVTVIVTSPGPSLIVTAPTPNHIFPAGTTQTTLTVSIANHVGSWSWKLNDPFPASGPADGTIVESGSTATVSDLQNGQTYTVYATLVGTDGNVLSPPVTANVTFSVASPAPPAMPTLVSPPNGSTNQPTTLTFTWNTSGGAVTYRLQVSTDLTFATTVFDNAAVTDTSRQVESLAYNTTCYWRVSATNAYGTSDRSSVWSFTTVSASLDQWASSVIAFSSQYDSDTWSAAQALGEPNTSSYGDIETSWAPGSKNGTLEFLTLGFSTPVYADSVTIRETYGNGFVYQVDVLDMSDALHTVWTGIDPSPPGSPVNFRVSWTRTAFLVKGVKIYVNTNHDPDAWEEIDAVRLHGGLEPGAAPAPTLAITVPTPNQVLSAGVTSTTLTVSVANHTGHWHWRLNTPFPESGPAGGDTIMSGNSTTITGLQNGQTDTVYVALVDADHNVLRPPITASITFSVVLPPPPAPTGLMAIPGDRRVTLTWHQVSGVTSYNVYMGEAPGVGKTVNTMIHQEVASPFPHTELVNGKTYYFVVTAVGPGGESGLSAEVGATPQASTVTPITIVVGAVSGAVGREVLVPARIGKVVLPDTTGDDVAGTGIIKTRFEIGFDKDRLDFLDVTLGDGGVLGEAGHTVNLKVESGLITIGSIGTIPLPRKGLLFLLRLKIKAGSAGDGLPLDLRVAELTARASADPADPGYLLPVRPLSGRIDILSTGTPQPIRGDVNHNGLTTAFDGILILRFLIGLESASDTRDFRLETADVNRDGKISALDASLVFRFDAGIITTFPEIPQKPALTEERAIAISEPQLLWRVDRGDGTTIVPVTLDDRSDVVAGEMTLGYDPALIEIAGVSPAEGLPGWYVAGRAEDGRLRVAFAGAEAGAGKGDLLLITVRLLRERHISGSSLTIAESVLNDGMIAVTVRPGVPVTYVLSQNVPNPFNPETQIRFELPEAGHVTLVVYSLTGRTIRTLVDGQWPAGQHTVVWDGRDEGGGVVTSGVYVYRLTAGTFTATKKMVLVR